MPVTVAVPSRVLPSYTTRLSPLPSVALKVPASASTVSSVLLPAPKAPVKEPLVASSSVTVVITTVCCGAAEVDAAMVTV